MQKTRRTQQYSSLIISIVQTEEKCLKIVTTISVESENLVQILLSQIK
jgi:hypothetical protein